MSMTVESPCGNGTSIAMVSNRDGVANMSDTPLCLIESHSRLTKSSEKLSSAGRLLLIVMAEFDERTDIYSLGIMIYEMLTGKRPFPEDNLAELLDLHVREDTPDPRIMIPDLPQELSGVLMKSIRKDPAERFGSISEVIEKLRSLAEKIGLQLQPSTKRKQKMTGLFVFYKDEHQLELNRLLDKLNSDISEIGAVMRVANIEDV